MAFFVSFLNILSGFVHNHSIIILLSRCWVRPVSFRCFKHVCQYSRGVWCCGHRDVTVMCCVVSGVLNTAFVKTAEEYNTVEIEMSLWCAVLFQVF